MIIGQEEKSWLCKDNENRINYQKRRLFIKKDKSLSVMRIGIILVFGMKENEETDLSEREEGES